MSARCPKKHCREFLADHGCDAIGRIILVCEPCERNKRGLCRDCPARLTWRPGRGYGVAMRCPSCTRRRYAQKQKARYRQNPEHFRGIARKSWHQPHRLERKRQWRAEWLKKNPRPPRDLHDRLYSRAWAAKHLSDPANRERQAERMRRYRKDPVVRRRLNAGQRRRNAENREQLRASDRRRRAEKRRQAVLSGQVRRLTPRDRAWLAVAEKQRAA